jgi:hypothetical protein
MSKPNSTRLRELLNYDPDTGLFTRKVGVRGYAAGSIVGTPHSAGYVYCNVDGHRCYAHQLAWCYVHGDWPEGELDHRNGVRNDNRIDNLRLATRSQNMLNKHRPRGDNQSGFLGVVAHKNRWRADLTVDGKQKYLGLFDTAEEAHAAYLAAKKLLSLKAGQ